MALTRAQVELLLLKRAAKRMAFVEMDAVTCDGSNEDLAEPISTALQRMGIAPADITDPQDSDLTAVEDVLQLLDLAEVRLLENIVGNFDMVDLSVGPRRESLGQMVKDMEATISRLNNKIRRDYGLGVGTAELGKVVMNFQQEADDEL